MNRLSSKKKADKMCYCVGAIVAFLLLIIFTSHVSKKEHFQNIAKASDLVDGTYRIANRDGLPLTSNIITTVQCNDFLIGRTKPSSSLDWKLKRVAQSVYILYKDGEKECLYAHPTNSVRSYLFSNCNSNNLCGLQTLNDRGELDKPSLRTYFMILEHPSGKFYIKNMKNDLFLQMTKNKLSFVNKPNEDCLFSVIAK